MSDEDFNSYVPSIVNPRRFKLNDSNISLSQASIIKTKSLSLRRHRNKKIISLRQKEEANILKVLQKDVENVLQSNKITNNNIVATKSHNNNNNANIVSYSQSTNSSSFSFPNEHIEANNSATENLQKREKSENYKCDLISNSKENHCEMVDINLLNEIDSTVVANCCVSNSIIDFVDITSDICEDNHHNESDDNVVNEIEYHSPDYYFDIERKKKKLDNLYLNIDTSQTSTIKLKNQILNENKLVNGSEDNLTIKLQSDNSLYKQQKQIKFASNCTLKDLQSVDFDSDFSQHTESYSVAKEINCEKECNDLADDKNMSKPLRVCKSIRCDRGNSKSTSCSPTASRLPQIVNNLVDKDETSRARHVLTSSAPAGRRKSDFCSLNSQKRDESLSKLPYYKIVAGTHFAVDAFSYGDIKNVKHYFLTHFHSDHYCGLKKSFDKTLLCSKITADLCVTRLGVNSKCIQVLQLDETTQIEGTEVTAVDANHCPGSIMLIFALPNDKTILHTGDFRATPLMESYPIFWNKTIYTVYLDTTYCNPRFKFPSQDDSIDLAVHILKEKKISLENEGKKFSSVLIVCGTYTIGKEKFFLGLSRRVGCTIWASTEKQRVLRTCCGVTSAHEPAHSQLHVLPMRDICHDKLQEHLASVSGVFSEVVAFKPSGWESNHTSKTQRENITIHGIPYSEHSSFSELVRFVKFLKPQEVVPTVEISGGVKNIQKYFECPVVHSENISQSRITEYFSKINRETLAVT